MSDVNINKASMSNKVSMSSVIKSIKGRYILETLMYDNDYYNPRDDEEFCKYYQPKFMKILKQLSISMQKSGKSYMIENTPDDVLNILRLGCKNSAVKAFLSDSSLKLNIFVKSGDIYEQLENFHIFATSVKSFCDNNNLQINDTQIRRQIYNFANEKKYNEIVCMLLTMKNAYDTYKIVEILLSPANFGNDKFEETYQILLSYKEQQALMLKTLEEIKMDILLE